MIGERDGERDRPAGLAPRGSSAGFAIVMLYWVAIPALTCMTLMPFGRTVFAWLYPALACPVVALLVLLPTSVGFSSRRFWGVVLFRWATLAAIAFVPLSLLIAGGAILLTFRHPPALVSLTWTFAPVLLLLACLLPFPLRLLRLAYWDPKAARADWEIGNERVNPRVVRTLGGRR